MIFDWQGSPYLCNEIGQPACHSIGNKVTEGHDKEHESKEIGLADVDCFESFHGLGEENGEGRIRRAYAALALLMTVI